MADANSSGGVCFLEARGTYNSTHTRTHMENLWPLNAVPVLQPLLTAVVHSLQPNGCGQWVELGGQWPRMALTLDFGLPREGNREKQASLPRRSDNRNSSWGRDRWSSSECWVYISVLTRDRDRFSNERQRNTSKSNSLFVDRQEYLMSQLCT